MVGKIIAGYHVLEETTPLTGQIYEGSRIFKAVKADGDRFVAINFFPPEITKSKQLLQRLSEKLRIVARMDHPNLLPILGSGRSGEGVFLISPYLSAGSLQDRFDSGALSSLNIGVVIGEISDALEYAHSHGVLHGNLKPSDVLFTEDGNVQLSGFGRELIIRSLPQKELEKSNLIENYLPPEFMKGFELTPSSDQYSLGLILLEMLSGEPVSKMIRAVEAHQIQGVDRPSRPLQLRGDLSLKLMSIMARALADDPKHRFLSIADMNQAIQVALGLRTAPVKELSPAPEPQPIPPRRKRRPLAGIAAILAASLCFIVTVPALSKGLSGENGGILNFFLPNATSTVNVDLQGAELPPAIDKGGEEGNDGPSDPPEEVTSEDNGLAVSEPSPLPPEPQTKTEETNEGSGEEESPTPTPTAEGNPTSETTPTPTVVLTVTSSPTETPASTSTLSPSPTEPAEPTIKPGKCKDDPDHKNYCTPTP